MESNFGFIVKVEHSEESYLVLVEKFSSNSFLGNGLKWKFPIVWCDPERDSDLRDREVAFFIRKSGVSKHYSSKNWLLFND